MIWTPLSFTHLESAKHLARLSQELEDKCDGKFMAKNVSKNKTYVIGSIFAAVAYLESTINELIAEAEDGDAHTLRPTLTEAEINKIKKNSDTIESAKAARNEGISLILHKYKSFLKTIGRPDLETSLLLEVGLLINLRNKLVHYKPKWISLNPTENHDMEKKLEGKFEGSKFYEGTRNPFYPNKCLGSGCAAWAVKTAEKFVNHFNQQLQPEEVMDSDQLRKRGKPVNLTKQGDALMGER